VHTERAPCTSVKKIFQGSSRNVIGSEFLSLEENVKFDFHQLQQRKPRLWLVKELEDNFEKDTEWRSPNLHVNETTTMLYMTSAVTVLVITYLILPKIL
jgi:hypothetical protein